MRNKVIWQFLIIEIHHLIFREVSKQIEPDNETVIKKYGNFETDSQ